MGLVRLREQTATGKDMHRALAGIVIEADQQIQRREPGPHDEDLAWLSNAFEGCG